MKLRTIGLLACSMSMSGAQWLHYPSPGTPRTKDGKANLSAATPRARDGKPDLSGVWQIEPTPVEELNKLFGDVTTFDVPGDDSGTYSKYLFSILSDYRRDESPLLPAAAALAGARAKSGSAGVPTSRCLPGGVPFSVTVPFPFKIIQTPGLTLVMHESDSSIRQIYTDRRKHTPDPQPTWTGYSVGRWEGDALVVDTRGFNDRGWLDAGGTPHSEALHTVERMRREDFGHLRVEVTLEDPEVFAKPVVIHYAARLLPDTDIQENVCAENEKDVGHFR